MMNQEKHVAQLPFDETAFKTSVNFAWQYLAPGETTHWRCVKTDRIWKAVIAPVFQRVVGDADAETQSWAHGWFDLQAFGKQNGVRVDYFKVVTHFKDQSLPRIVISGEFGNEPFQLMVFLQPLPGSAACELVDLATKDVTAIEVVESDLDYDDDNEPMPTNHCDLHTTEEYRLPTVREALQKNICLSKECYNGMHWLLIKDFESVFRDDLIPELIECTEDEDPELRRRAIELLHKSSSRDPAVLPLLIKSLEDDDSSVRQYMLYYIHHYGPAAAAAIPVLETLFHDSNEHIRLLAVVDVLSLDPSRTELLNDVYDALESELPYVQDIARGMLAKLNKRLPFNEPDFHELVQSNWQYTQPGNRTYWRCTNAAGAWKAVIAPVFQEVYGGPDDGTVTWAEAEYLLSLFGEERGIEITDARVFSQGGKERLPVIKVSGMFFGVLFELEIYLQPISGSSVCELVDLHKKRLKGIGNEEPDKWKRFAYYHGPGGDDEDDDDGDDEDDDDGEEWKRGIHPP